MERVEHHICYVYGGRTSYQSKLLVSYDEAFVGDETNDATMKEPSYVHYAGVG